MAKKFTDNTVQEFRQYLYEEEKSENTIEKYMRDIRFFREWLGDKALTKQTVLEYKKNLCESYAPTSTNSMLSSLNTFFAFLNRNDLKVKTLKIQHQIFASQEKELTQAEYDRLLSAAKLQSNKKLYMLMQTIASTGIRVSELRYITVEAVRAEKAFISCKGKMRTVILPSKLCMMLKEYIQEEKITSGSVFVTKRGTPLDRNVIWKLMKGLCEIADVEQSKVFPHNLRHLFARTFYSLERDIVRLADILGHSSVNTTRIYTMETGETHKMQIQRLGLLRL